MAKSTKGKARHGGVTQKEMRKTVNKMMEGSIIEMFDVTTQFEDYSNTGPVRRVKTDLRLVLSPKKEIPLCPLPTQMSASRS